MLIATWNVNSIRSRLTHVQDWLQQQQPDVLCLQETKVVDSDFPVATFAPLGYYCHIYGQKSYNGVAILTRDSGSNLGRGFGDPPWDEQKRLIHIDIQGLRIVNVYVPNGSEVGSDKYAYKLAWLQHLHAYLHPLMASPLLICGDFNIGPDHRDLPDAKYTGQIMASEAERQALQNLISLGLHDAFRHFTPEPGHYSWWDYRAASFRRNHGWRIDHIYLNDLALPWAKRCWIDPAPRRLEKPSDHTPVIVEIGIPEGGSSPQ
ncbi:MAG: exodeoxyribonuclease III [Synechococcales cyanobacterium]